MALGDAKTGFVSLAAGDTLDIKPPVGEEWIIHNLYYNGPVELSRTNGVDNLKFDNDTASGARLGYFFHNTTDVWLRVKNAHATAVVLVSFDGVQTK